MKKLIIIAIVAIFAATASAGPLDPPWLEEASVTIPVVMDITPVAAISLNGAQIKLFLTDQHNMPRGDIFYEGVADPLPILTANVSVEVTASIAALEPTISTGPPFKVALRNQDYVPGTTDPVTYDPAVIGSGIGIEVAASIKNPDLTVRPEGLDVPVAEVTLTVTPE